MPWKKLLAWATGQVDDALRQKLEFVLEENRVYRALLDRQQEWNWDRVPWRVGVDFRAPTCAVCHSSLITSPEDNVIAQRTHDFGARLWVRLFGLPYSHSQPKSGATLIKNKDG